MDVPPSFAETNGLLYDSPCRHRDGAERQVFVVCGGTECKRKGASKLLALLRQMFGLGHCEGNARIGASHTCMGHCATAPVMMRNGNLLRWVSVQRLKAELAALRHS